MESGGCCGKALPALHPKPFLKGGLFPAQVKAEFRFGLQLLFICTAGNKSVFLLSFYEMPVLGCSPLRIPTPRPEACAPGWRQSRTGRRGAGGRRRHGGGGAGAWEQGEQRRGMETSSAGGRSAFGHFSPSPGDSKDLGRRSSAACLLVHAGRGDANLRGGSRR